jgi:hypothetical protein
MPLTPDDANCNFNLLISVVGVSLFSRPQLTKQSAQKRTAPTQEPIYKVNEDELLDNTI